MQNKCPLSALPPWRRISCVIFMWWGGREPCDMRTPVPDQIGLPKFPAQDMDCAHPIHTPVHLYSFVASYINLYPSTSICFQLYPFASNCINLYPSASICIHLTKKPGATDAKGEIAWWRSVCFFHTISNPTLLYPTHNNDMR